MQRILFKANPKGGFYETLNVRVNEYFRRRGIDRHTNAKGVFKLLMMLVLYAALYVVILSGKITGSVLLLLVFIFGVWAMITAACVIHDAVHRAFSKHQVINEFLVVLVDLFGVNGYIWRKTHVDAHHNYTNLIHEDLDLIQNGLVRFVPNMEHRWFHNYQHIYMPVLYLFTTVFIVFARDFKNFTLKEIGRKQVRHPLREYLILFLTKAFYFFYILVIPFLLLDLEWWQLAIGFLLMHMGSSFIFTLMLLCSHIQEGSVLMKPDVMGEVNESWAVHEFNATVDCSPDSKLLTILFSGLNHHVAHHLFPNVAHIHLPALTKITVKTAEEFGLHYKSNSLFGQFWSHLRLLRSQGKQFSTSWGNDNQS
ncbi:MAG: fatty acid desaturase [Salibacteraceae bacterium]